MIETFLDESKLPFRTLEQKVFDAAVDYVFRNFPKWGKEVNATLAALNALAAGGAYAFPFIYDGSTVDGRPGVGKLRLSNTIQTGSATLRMDIQIIGGVDISNVLADLRSVTSAVKGSVRLVKMTDPSKWAIFDVSAVALPTGYRNLSVVARASSGSNPFTNGDALLVYIDRNGDSGTVPGATELLGTIPVPSGASVLNALNVFDTDHDWYFMHFMQVATAALSRIDVRLAVAGALVSSATGYWQANANADAVLTGARSSSFRLRATGAESPVLLSSGVLQVGDVNSPNSKAMLWDGFGQSPTDAFRAHAVRGAFLPSGVVTGFGLILDASTTFTGGTIRVYGVRKQ